ncbi:MAG: adenylate cyclase, partial [Pseudoalteromonas tetraodonis]
EPTEFPGASDQPYDARARPWFLEAVKFEGLVWTRPYRFLNGEALGITAALARRDEEGKVLGVFAADFVLDDLAMFLDKLEVGESGAAFLLLDDGSFPVPANSRMHSNNAVLRAALKSQDWDLTELDQGGAIEKSFKFEDESYVALIQRVALPGETRYYAGVIVPEADFLGVVWRNAKITIGLASIILVVAALLGTLLSRRVTRPLAEIGEELEQIGHLRFRDDGQRLPSSIREVSQFSKSVGKMKRSLRAFSRYVPRDVVRQLLTDGDDAQLGGCTQEVTVVFTDLADFTRISEGLPAEQAFRELSDFLEIVADTQHHHGGITSSFTGDGTLAIFNAPEPLEQHSLKACLAAWDCLYELRKLNQRRLAEGKPEFRARIGINTADVLLGNLGTRERFAYTAIGDGVNLASRIEALNKLYSTEILVSEATRRAAGDAFEWRMVDRIAVVGRTQATVLYRPLGPAGRVDDALLRCRDLSEAGLQLYFDGAFTEAEELFTKAAVAHPEDHPSLVLAERCRVFAKSPPEPNWGGTFSALVK